MPVRNFISKQVGLSKFPLPYNQFLSFCPTYTLVPRTQRVPSAAVRCIGYISAQPQYLVHHQVY